MLRFISLLFNNSMWMAQLKGWLSSARSFRAPGTFSVVATISLTLTVCVVKAGLLLLWYSLREEQGIQEHMPGILRPGPGSGAHHFLFSSAGENAVRGPHPATGRLSIWLWHYYHDLTTDKRPGPQGPHVSSWTRTKTSCCFFPWVLISEIAGGILVFGSPLFTSEIF